MNKKPIMERLADIEKRLAAIERANLANMPLGPNPKQDEELDQDRESIVKQIIESVQAEPVDRSCQILTDGSPVPEDRSHTKLRADGQQEGYVVLCDAERAKGFVRPYRDAYRHVGPTGPRFPTRGLTAEEHERYDSYGYVQFEVYPEGHKGSSIGRFWTQKDLDRIGKGCKKITTMGRTIAETYARDPFFYSGTFCCHCGAHFPVGENGEFTWYEMDGREGPRVGT